MTSQQVLPALRELASCQLPDLLAQQKRFLGKAGAVVKDGVEIELAPALTYAGEGLECVKGKTFTKSGHAATLDDLLSLL